MMSNEISLDSDITDTLKKETAKSTVPLKDFRSQPWLRSKGHAHDGNITS